MAETASYTYAGLLIVGGLAGAAKGSAASLISAGAAAATLLALETAGATRAPFASSVAQSIVAGGLCFMMGNRFANSGKIMPAGLVAALSGVMFVVYATRAAGGFSRR